MMPRAGFSEGFFGRFLESFWINKNKVGRGKAEVVVAGLPNLEVRRNRAVEKDISNPMCAAVFAGDGEQASFVGNLPCP